MPFLILQKKIIAAVGPQTDGELEFITNDRARLFVENLRYKCEHRMPFESLVPPAQVG